MSHSITSGPQLLIQPLYPGDVPGVTRCYASVFLTDEPMTRYCRIGPELFLPPAHVYVSLCASDLLSYIVKDTISGDSAGFIFCSDLSTDWSSRDPRMAEIFSLFHEITCVLGRLEMYYHENYPSGPGEALHIFQVGITPLFRGLGVAKALVRTALENARDRGFSYALAECTSPASRSLFCSCGFVSGYKIPFQELSLDGACYFRDIPGEITLMVREL